MKILMRSSSIFFLSVLLYTLQSCSGPDPVDAREINDSEGLNIDLEWTTGGSLAQSKDDVDLDIRLLKGTTVVDQGFTLSFEHVELKNIYADGEYSLKIDVATANAGSTYKVYVSGINSSEKKEYQGTTTTSDEGATIEFLTIRKTGSRYIIQQ
jgi:hypothetical protein